MLWEIEKENEEEKENKMLLDMFPFAVSLFVYLISQHISSIIIKLYF